ncbi:MAG TPA: hypothetical protein VIJ14_07820, partial [Rhabdochlamydiaceae bacterium]
TKFNRSAWLIGPVVGVYRITTGAVDMIRGIFNSELFRQGAGNFVRGSFESLVVVIPLALALKYQHSLGLLALSEVKNISLELLARTNHLFAKHFVAMTATYFLANLVCQVPLAIYDHLALKYHLAMVKSGACQERSTELYHDLNLIKKGHGQGMFYEYNCDEKIEDLEIYGKDVCTDA